MLEHAFSGLVSRENVKIRLFFCKAPVLDEKMFLCNKKTKYMAMN